MALFVASLILAVALHVLFCFYCYNKKVRAKSKINPTTTTTSSTSKERRKQNFLAATRHQYGYRDTPIGFIDDWRYEEFPNLVSPLTKAKSIIRDSQEVYLDSAGAALPSRSLLTAIYKNEIEQAAILANPHSTGPAAEKTFRLVEETKKLILDHFQAHPGRFSNLSSDTTRSTSSPHYHPGYDVLFTSGTTDSCRIVAQQLSWNNNSVLLYSHNVHTSVIGMRGPVLQNGGNFLCKPLMEILNLQKEDQNLDQTITDWLDTRPETDSHTNNLLVLPLECNFDGTRIEPQTLLQKLRNTNKDNRSWYSMLDLAKAASTSPINLKQLDPEFAAMSFYKLFGAPTGLGVLLVRRTATHLLTNQSSNSYFGGGSVDVVLAGSNFAVGRNLGASSSLQSRKLSSSLASLQHGTTHFRGIVALKHGFQELQRYGGMQRIQQHTHSLAKELSRRLRLLKHWNQQAVVVLYGAWARNDNTTTTPGPVVTFNVVRSNGVVVGYNEVAKLAALNQPPIQLRTGCFCNPGACQQAMELTDQEIIENYTTGGHVCGDEVDVVNGKPVGAIRASFGKESTWEDLDALVQFIQKHFVASVPPAKRCDKTKEEGPVRAFISEIYIYPIKSCAGQTVKRWKISSPFGRLQWDREFALVDSFGTAMRLQKYPKMARIRPVIDPDERTLTVSAPDMKNLVLKLDSDSNDLETTVSVCGNKCGGIVWGDVEASQWFTEYLGVECWLARSTETSHRSKPAFSNDQPILLISQHSVNRLNAVLREQNQPLVNAKHFRPNLVVNLEDFHQEEAIYHPEDSWKTITVANNKASFLVCGLCARCQMIDVDPTTGTKGKTLRALAEYRRGNRDINFGIFLRSNETDFETEWLEKGMQISCQ